MDLHVSLQRQRRMSPTEGVALVILDEVMSITKQMAHNCFILDSGQIHQHVALGVLEYMVMRLISSVDQHEDHGHVQSQRMRAGGNLFQVVDMYIRLNAMLTIFSATDSSENAYGEDVFQFIGQRTQMHTILSKVYVRGTPIAQAMTCFVSLISGIIRHRQYMKVSFLHVAIEL